MYVSTKPCGLPHGLIGLALALVVCFILAVGFTSAAAQGGPPPGGIAFTDDELKAFANAFESISEISDEYENKFKNARDPQRANQLKNEANGKMVEAVEKEGLSVRKYNQIHNATRTDERVREQVNRLLSDKG